MLPQNEGIKQAIIDALRAFEPDTLTHEGIVFEVSADLSGINRKQIVQTIDQLYSIGIIQSWDEKFLAFDNEHFLECIGYRLNNEHAVFVRKCA